ncbi:3,4-dihydroxy-2-butanone-4-phosphate synthase [Nocardia nova]|uniref:3,4-dihydroxy-2-butanone-4-phosphate synthase n=1 Tax=Nocardia nova TaxID=37330 RepID=UPI0018949700|nr:3,4-dihydroxy-2-butanone-4-phosphate synthase [Nocardia nova]MBF6148397.1 3,4-dihydroxy-2-butanone-4-phosphate synthase [Nocardia nova]MDN2496296.1 3,4-dihydroxy-2-butanone 4-phosphate synthase [Nocardia nova]
MTMMYEAGTLVAQTITLSPSGPERDAHRRVRTATAALAGGAAVLLCDDLDRPRRGEIVFPAECADEHTTAFAVRHTSGFLQVALPADRCTALGLTAQCGADDPTAGQCVTVDAAERVGTGISAADRATTAAALAATESTTESFTRPGHLVPVRVDTNRGVSGFAEAALQLVTAAGRRPAALFATLVGIADPTGLAAGQDLTTFADRHHLPLVGLNDLTAHTEPDTVFDSAFELPAGRTRMLMFEDTGVSWTCLLIGDIQGVAEVPLQVVPAEHLLLEAGARSRCPHILVAAASGHTCDPREHRAVLVDRIGTSSSTLRRILRNAGVQAVRVDIDVFLRATD